MRPWKTALLAAGRGAQHALQWGHGDEAVEDEVQVGPGNVLPKKLQWGHGDEAVEDRRRSETNAGADLRSTSREAM